MSQFHSWMCNRRQFYNDSLRKENNVRHIYFYIQFQLKQQPQHSIEKMSKREKCNWTKLRKKYSMAGRKLNFIASRYVNTLLAVHFMRHIQSQRNTFSATRSQWHGGKKGIFLIFYSAFFSFCFALLCACCTFQILDWEYITMKICTLCVCVCMDQISAR